MFRETAWEARGEIRFRSHGGTTWLRGTGWTARLRTIASTTASATTSGEAPRRS